MTAPSLDELRDIHLPPAPELATLQPFWWQAVAGLALLAATLWLARRFVRQRPLRAALRELAGLEAAHACDADATQLARGLSRLLRRYAIARFSQAGVEGLTDSAWLAFLDAHGGGEGAFSHGVGAILAARPYQRCGAFDEAALLALVRRWLKANGP